MPKLRDIFKIYTENKEEHSIFIKNSFVAGNIISETFWNEQKVYFLGTYHKYKILRNIKHEKIVKEKQNQLLI